GRYVSGESEPATGLTLYPDAVLRAAPTREARPRIYMPQGTSPERAHALRGEGYATVAALDVPGDPRQAAALLDCTHYLADGAVIPVSE
ncbi:MAG TPA: ATP phosphoribosyltransferase regulatory subunit, partial [Acetobacteraceae bacterium]